MKTPNLLSRIPQAPTLLGALLLSAGCATHQSTEIRDWDSNYDRSRDPHSFTIFMEDGGWCWFQDPRAIIQGDYLIMGSVKGNAEGEALIGVYDLEKKTRLPNFVAHPSFDRDDHNSPVFFEREDGSLLATYARHGKNKFHHSRISAPNDPTQWGEEFVHERTVSKERDRVTYMNLYELESEGTLYNFYRQIEYNPTVVMSKDEGLTWSEPTHFFANAEGGRHRPYGRYTSNGTDTIHASVTDAHPRNYGNNLYYFAFREGNYYKADGTLIKNLERDGPLTLGEVERVYEGSNDVWNNYNYVSVPNSAWTSSITLDAGDNPHMAYSVYFNNGDNRYRLASWNGSEWIDREIAYAGTCLYPREASYTGLVTLDPEDPTVVFISTNVNPTTGVRTRRSKHEIYRAKIGPNDDINTIEWQAVTENSPVMNIRPVILRHEGQRIVVWLRGDYQTWKDYDLDKVGFIESVTEATTAEVLLDQGFNSTQPDQFSAHAVAKKRRVGCHPSFLCRHSVRQRTCCDAPLPQSAHQRSLAEF